MHFLVMMSHFCPAALSQLVIGQVVFVRFTASNESSHPLADPTSSSHPRQDGSAPVVDQRLLLPWHVPGSSSDPGQRPTLPGL